MASLSYILLVCCLSITAIVATAILNQTQDVHYGILMDAGSSSTKLKVYNWTWPDPNTGVPRVSLVPVSQTRFKPGLANLEGNIPGMTTYLTEILNVAKQAIPADQYSETPVFVMATAGFRMLGVDGAENGMEDVEMVLKDSSVHPFLYRDGQASVLSGEEEGVYAWLAANYLLGFFDTNRPATEAVGVLEMGGASTQIVFVPREQLMAEEFHVRMASRHYSLYVQSYLQFGVDVIKNRVIDMLVDGLTPGANVVFNPCLLTGDVQTLDRKGRMLTMMGVGNARACRKLYDELVVSAPPERCYLEPCAIGSVFQPSVQGIEFYATQVYRYSLERIGAIRDNETLDLANVFAAAEQYCRKDLMDFPVDDREFASTDCGNSVYINSILTGPYGFPKDTYFIQATNHINGENIDWALGAMLEYLSLTFTGDPAHCSTQRGH